MQTSLRTPRTVPFPAGSEAPRAVLPASACDCRMAGGMPRQLGDLQKADSARPAKVIRDGNTKPD